MSSVFISYSTKDRGFVEQLVKDLRSNGVQPWYDKWEMLPGDSLTRKIGEAILENDFFIVILSPNSVNSEWVQQELSVALNREFGERRVRVIPALLHDCEVPPFLRDKVYANFQVSYNDGLYSLLRAIGQSVTNRFVSTLPKENEGSVVWDNVVSNNLTDSNIVRNVKS